MATITDYFEERGYNIFEHNDYENKKSTFYYIKAVKLLEFLKTVYSKKSDSYHELNSRFYNPFIIAEVA